MANIIEKTGKSYNIFDKINNVWNKCSFWTHSNDVFYPDGKSATTKHGAINGITSDLTGEAEDIAASIKCVNQLNSSLNTVSSNLENCITKNFQIIDIYFVEKYNEFAIVFKDNPNSDYSYQFVISGNKYRFDKVTSGEINTLFIRNFV